MSGLRIKRETAELIGLPPMEWTVKTTGWILEQNAIQKNIHRVGINEPLLESIERDGMLNPILVMPNWYPICGSQRLRACVDIQQKFMGLHPILKQEVRVCKFDKEYWNAFHLWPDEEFRSKAIQVYFQMIELAFKSIHFIEDDPMRMIKFETDGDNLKWKARDG